jgi:hypothetical protein
MKKYRENGTCYMEGDFAGPFVNVDAAIMAAQVMQLYFAKRNLSTSLRMFLEVGSIELTVHLEGATNPALPRGYHYSKKRVTSHEYFSEYEKAVVRVRCLEFYFTYNQTSF